jgi:hypothetical protein
MIACRFSTRPRPRLPQPAAALAARSDFAPPCRAANRPGSDRPGRHPKRGRGHDGPSVPASPPVPEP